jgi:uncharacterized linocin/CFP29 family protein
MGQPLNLKVVEDAPRRLQEEEFIYHGQPDFHLHGLLTAQGRNTFQGGDWSSVDQVLDNVIAAVNTLDGKGYRGPYGLALAPALYNNLFRRYPGSDLLQIEHLKRLCTRGIVKAQIEGGVLVAKDVGSLSSDRLQIAYSVPMRLTKLCRDRVARAKSKHLMRSVRLHRRGATRPDAGRRRRNLGCARR